METYNFRLRKRENPSHYHAGFESGLETALYQLRRLETLIGSDPEFASDFGDGVKAALASTRTGLEKSLKSLKTTRALFEASGIPPTLDN